MPIKCICLQNIFKLKIKQNFWSFPPSFVLAFALFAITIKAEKRVDGGKIKHKTLALAAFKELRFTACFAVLITTVASHSFDRKQAGTLILSYHYRDHQPI